MTYPPVFPPGRSLAEWWGQLASFHPKSCWLAYLSLHHLNARVRCLANAPLDRLHRLIMRAMQLMPDDAGGDFLTSLDERLFLGESTLRQILRTLVERGLVEKSPSGAYSVSALGSEALAVGQYSAARFERRDFTFVERVDQNGQRLPPHFVALQGCKGEPWVIDEAHQFDPAWLAECLARPAEWKRDFGFPGDVLEIAQLDETDRWQNIIVDRGELALVVFVQTNQFQLLGFAIHRETWKLLASAPVISLGNSWSEVFPMLAADLPADAYQHAWRAAAMERGITEVDALACQASAGENALQVTAPTRLADALRRIRNESSKGQACTLVGTGAARKIVRITIDMV